MKYCIWGNRGIGDMIFMLPAIHSILRNDAVAQVYVSEGVYGPFSRSFAEVLPRNVVLLENPSAQESETVRKRVAASTFAEKNYWSQKIMEERLAGLCFDFFYSQRRFSFDDVHARQKFTGESGKDKHEVELYLDLIKASEIEPVIDFRFRNVPMYNKRTSHYVGILPDSARAEKDLPAESLETLLREIDTLGLHPLLITNHKRNNAYTAHCIKDLIDLLLKCRLVIGVDTGPLHIADALGIQCIGLYGPTSSKHYGPYNNLVHCIAAQTGHMSDLKMDEAISIMNALL